MNEMRDDHLTHLLHSLERQAEPDPVFADRLFGQLSAAAARPARGGSRLFMLLAAALMLAAIGTGVALGSGLIHLPGLSREPLPAPTASSTANEVVQSPSASLVPTPTASPTHGASPSAVTGIGIAVDGLVSTNVDGLTIRKGPGTSQEGLGTLAKGSLSYVVDGPQQADGYDWYLISGMGLPAESGCETTDDATHPFICPMWFGWAAAGGGATDVWLSPTEIDCSDPSPATPLAARQQLVPLACFGSQSLTVRGYWPTIPADAGLGGTCAHVPNDLMWIRCDLGYNFLLSERNDGFSGAPTLAMAVPPGFTMPERGQWLEVTGHYDDPAAQQCTYADPVEQSVLWCRSEFVVDDAQQVGGPG